MSSADDHGHQAATAGAELRADIRRLGDLLGETLVRQEGADLLELVERVRRLTREDGEAAARLLGDTELETAAQASPSPQQVEILQDGFERLTRLWAAAKSGLF